MSKLTKEQLEKEAIEIVDNERKTWEKETAWITPEVGFNMRNLIKTLWRNYWGVFSDPIDKVSGRKKIWYPLTEIMVEHAVKSYDLDMKDINVLPRTVGSIPLTKVVRAFITRTLEKLGFGEKIDISERALAVQGTFVWKTLEKLDKDTREKTIQIEMPHLLNIYIDPTAPSIQEAYRFTERALLTKSELKRMTGWINTNIPEPTEGLSRMDYNLKGFTKTGKYIDVWETWGLIPKYLITGDFKDTEEVEGHIVVSGLENRNPVVHLIEENRKGIRPYEEAWYQRVPGRWYGRGVAEKLMWLQLWINIVANTRITRSYVSQLGIFKIRRGSNITPQMLSRLVANGAILVNNQDDIQQLVIQEASSASYKDEQNIFEISRQLTSVFESMTGETLPSNTSATAASVAAQSAQSQFTLIRKGIGLFLERWIKRQLMPIILKNLKPGDVIRIMDDEEVLRELDEYHIDKLLINEIIKANQEGKVVSPEQVISERERALEKLRKMGNARFVKLLKSVDPFDYDVAIDITNEKLNKGVLMQNLLTALQTIQDTQVQRQIAKMLFDVMGVNVPVNRLPEMPVQQAEKPSTQNPTDLFTKGNTTAQ